MNQLSNNEYIFRKEENQYFLKNIIDAGDTVIGYTLTSKDCSTGEFTLVEQGSIEQEEEVLINITNDNIYKLTISGITESTLTINHFNNLFSSVIKDIELILCSDCGCGCTSDCIPKEVEDCVKYQKVFNNIIALKSFVKPITNDLLSLNLINQFIDEAINNNSCSIIEDFCSQQASLSIEGEAPFNSNLFKKFVAIYYLALYKYDILLSTEEELDYINQKYNYSVISKCIKKLGICIDSILNTFDSIVQINNTPPLVDPITIQLTPVIENNNYESSYTFELTDFINNFVDAEGDDPFKVKIYSLPLVGELLYNGVPVVEGFSFNNEDSDQLVYKIQIDTNEVLSLPFTDLFLFQISDNNDNSLYSIPTKVNIQILQPSELPASCVDTVEFTLAENQELVLDDASFINAFTDGDGDALDKIRIILDNNIPITIKLNGELITSGQIIDISDISAGLLTAEITGDITGIPSLELYYEAADAGTGIFIGTCNT